MAFVSIEESSLIADLKKIREKGDLQPVKFGFRSWNQYDQKKYLMFSRGTYTMIGGEAHHGKTYFTNELVMQMIEKHDFKVALFSNESGRAQNVFSTFYSLYVGKSFSKIRPDGSENKYAMTDQEMHKAMDFFNGKLFVWSEKNKVKEPRDLDRIYKEVSKTEYMYGFSFDSVVIDPIYDIDDFEPKAEAVRKTLERIDSECKEKNRCDIVVNHVADTPKLLNQKTGKRKKSVAMADEFYGGKNNNRKAYLQILIHRPEPNTDPEHPEDYIAENQTDVWVLKAKPEGIAFMGRYELFWDWKTKRFYEMHEDKMLFADCVSFDKEKKEFDVKSFKQNPNEVFQVEKNDNELMF